MTTFKIDMKQSNQYAIVINPPEDKNQLWGAWCEDLELSAFGETKQQAFYNLVQNIPEYFAIQNERSAPSPIEKFDHDITATETYFIPAFT